LIDQRVRRRGDLSASVVSKKPVRSARKAKGDGHLRRAEILHAAEVIFVRDGHAGATIRKIADEVGVSSTALYMHFRDKDQILKEICETAIATMLANNTEISRRPIDAVSRVRMMLQAYMDFGLENPNAYRLVFCDTVEEVSPERSDLTDLGAQTYERFKSVVAELAREGRLRYGDADTATQMLWMACHGLVALRITRPRFEWRAADELAAAMLDSLLHGLVTD
jgi:AcrR family transcriptional regulator